MTESESNAANIENSNAIKGMVNEPAALPNKRVAEVLYGLHSVLPTSARAIARNTSLEKADNFRDRILPEVAWPTKINIGLPDYQSLSRARQVHRSLPKNSFFSKKMMRDVQFESTLEHRVYWLLELSDEVLYYQEQPLAIPYCAEEGQANYYPDVLIWLRSGRCILAEVKTLTEIGLYINQQKFAALKQFCELQGWGMLVTDGRRTLRFLQDYKPNPRFTEHILETLKQGPLDWPSYRTIRAKYGCNNVDLNSLILAENIAWTLRPFCLKLLV